MKKSNEQKQIFWFTIIGYIGTLIGVMSTVYIYPNDKALLGLFRFIETVSLLLFPIMVFGTGQALIYFHPKISNKNKNTLFEYGLVSILVFSILLFLVVIGIDQFFNFKNYIYSYYAFAIAFFLAFTELFKRHAINVGKLAVPSFFEKIIPKIALPTIFILVLHTYINIEYGLTAFVVSYGLIVILLAFYVFKINPIGFNFRFQDLFSEIPKSNFYSYSLFGFLGSFGSLLAFRIDTLMIPQFLSFDDNGTYSIGVVLASVIAIPATAVFTYYSPMISKYIENNDLKSLSFEYTENAKLLFFIGALFYGAMFLGINDLFQLFPTYNKLVDSIPLALILGANVVFNMGTGFSNEIMSFSKYYKINIFLLFILVLLNVVFNIYVLTQTDYGLIGVAWATFISLNVFNIVKLLFIYKKYKMLPFDRAYLKLVLLLVIVGVLFSFIPDTSSNVLNIILKSVCFVFFSIFLVYKFKLVKSLKLLVNRFLFKIVTNK